jgi:hypothetical protein
MQHPKANAHWLDLETVCWLEDLRGCSITLFASSAAQLRIEDEALVCGWERALPMRVDADGSNSLPSHLISAGATMLRFESPVSRDEARKLVGAQLLLVASTQTRFDRAIRRPRSIVRCQSPTRFALARLASTARLPRRRQPHRSLPASWTTSAASTALSDSMS